MRLPAVRWPWRVACALWLGLLAATGSDGRAGEQADREAEEAK
jgi:hypothetical protein